MFFAHKYFALVELNKLLNVPFTELLKCPINFFLIFIVCDITWYLQLEKIWCLSPVLLTVGEKASPYKTSKNTCLVIHLPVTYSTYFITIIYNSSNLFFPKKALENENSNCSWHIRGPHQICCLVMNYDLVFIPLSKNIYAQSRHFNIYWLNYFF